MTVSGVKILMVSNHYRYANIGHASIAKGKAFDILSKLDDRTNSFVPGDQL